MAATRTAIGITMKTGRSFLPPVHDEIAFFLFAILRPSDITNPNYDDADDCYEWVIHNEPAAPEAQTCHNLKRVRRGF